MFIGLGITGAFIFIALFVVCQFLFEHFSHGKLSSLQLPRTFMPHRSI
jgi:hypothetical protein